MKAILIASAMLALLSHPAMAEKKEFSHKSEAAIVTTGGNSELQTYNAQTENTYQKGKRSYKLSGHYTLGFAEAEENESDDLVESARNWDYKGQYEQEVSRNVSALAALQYEGNEFSGYTQRTNHDIGGKYTFVDTKKEKLYVELGLRYTEEHRTTDDENGRNIFYFNKGNLTTELQRKRDNISYGVWIQYLPNFTRSEDYQINIEPSFSVVINEIFSMKMSYKGNYDNEPNIEGNERLDWKYTTALVAEF